MTTIKVFTSRSCGPCATYKEQLSGLPNITYVDVDDPNNVGEAIAFNIRQVPTTVFESGEVLTGVYSREDIVRLMG